MLLAALLMVVVRSRELAIQEEEEMEGDEEGEEVEEEEEEEEEKAEEARTRNSPSVQFRRGRRSFRQDQNNLFTTLLVFIGTLVNLNTFKMINTVLTKKPRSTKDDDLRTFVRFEHGDLPARFTGVNSLHRKMRDYCLKDGMSLGVDVGVINVTFDTIKNAIESVLDDCLKGLPFFLPPLPSPLFSSSSFFFSCTDTLYVCCFLTHLILVKIPPAVVF